MNIILFYLDRGDNILINYKIGFNFGLLENFEYMYIFWNFQIIDLLKIILNILCEGKSRLGDE